jgi:hypothetical protein
MTVAAPPAAQRRFPSPPAARRSRKAMSPQRPQTVSRPHAPHPPLASSPAKKPVVFAPAQNNARHRPRRPHQRSIRDPKIPIGRARPNSALSYPRFPPYEAFGRRPRAQPRPPAKGRRPKPFSQAVIGIADLGDSDRSDAKGETRVVSGLMGLMEELLRGGVTASGYAQGGRPSFAFARAYSPLMSATAVSARERTRPSQSGRCR